MLFPRFLEEQAQKALAAVHEPWTSAVASAPEWNLDDLDSFIDEVEAHATDTGDLPCKLKAAKRARDQLAEEKMKLR